MRAGVFTGYAFDACKAPTTASLQAWAASPYRALGIYIGGANRACAQPNLTPQWVLDTTALGLEPAAAVRRPAGAVRRRRAGSSKLSTTLATADVARTRGRRRRGREGAGARAACGQPDLVRHGGLQGREHRLLERRALVRRRRGTTSCAPSASCPGVYGSAASTIRDVVDARHAAGPRVDRELERRPERLRRPLRQRFDLGEPPARASVQGRSQRDLRRRHDQHRQQHRRQRRGRRDRAAASAADAGPRGPGEHRRRRRDRQLAGRGVPCAGDGDRQRSAAAARPERLRRPAGGDGDRQPGAARRVRRAGDRPHREAVGGLDPGVLDRRDGVDADQPADVGGPDDAAS